MNERTLHERASEIFGAASEMDASERSQFLDQYCAADRVLREYVDRLFAHDSDEPLAPRAARELSRVVSETIPQEIAGYKIEKVIGRGGMGVVYLARQSNPSRDVAIKVLHHGTHDGAALMRFEREAELLAQLSHPGIARVFASGITDAVHGVNPRPYFVMEYVEGITLSEHLTKQALTVHDRVALLMQICDAVEHAHQRGIIHRDLKPSNVLVDREGRAILVDFGIAKVVAQDVDLTLTTDSNGATQALLGTLAYMSPEQLAGRSRDIDTRTDVYGLGVLAYETLCAKLPYDIRGQSLSHAILTIERDDPIRLCVQNPSLPIDLETVVMKALSADPKRRYASISAMRDDFSRWQDGLPVEARSRNGWYVALRFAQRHRVATVSVLAASLAIIAALVVTSLALNDAKHAREEAISDAARARAMTQFLEATVFGADPEIGGASMSFLDAVAYTANRIPNDLAPHPDLQADAHALLGFVLRRHGRFDDAEAHLRQAYRLRRDRLGEDHPMTAESMKELGELAREYGGRTEEAIQWLQQASAIYENVDVDPKRACWLSCNLGWALIDAGRVVEASRAFAQAQQQIEKTYPKIGRAYAGRALRGLALCDLYQGNHASAQVLIEDSIARQLRLEGTGQEYPLGRAYISRAHILTIANQPVSATESLAIAEGLLEPLLQSDHPIFGELAFERARVALIESDLIAANHHATAAHEIYQHALASGHWRLAEANLVINLVASLNESRNLNTAPFDRALERLQTRLGGNHPRVTWLLQQAATLYQRAGMVGRAEHIRRMLQMRRAADP